MLSQRTRASVALELLQNPEQFTSLSKRTNFERQLCLWRIPSFEPHSSWSLFRTNRSEEYYARRLEHDPNRGLPTNIDDPHVYGAEVPITSALAVEIIESFEALQLPIFRRSPWVGLDGISYGIRTGNYWQGASVNWWSSSSPEWKPLIELFDLTVARIDALLPASTLREYQP